MPTTLLRDAHVSRGLTRAPSRCEREPRPSSACTGSRDPSHRSRLLDPCARRTGRMLRPGVRTRGQAELSQNPQATPPATWWHECQGRGAVPTANYFLSHASSVPQHSCRLAAEPRSMIARLSKIEHLLTRRSFNGDRRPLLAVQRDPIGARWHVLEAARVLGAHGHDSAHAGRRACFEGILRSDRSREAQSRLSNRLAGPPG